MGWKLIVAADKPWTGEIYHTRPGRDRHRFSTIETFCSAFLAVTGWPLQANSSEAADRISADGQAAGSSDVSRRRSKSTPLHEIDSAKRKFIIAAEAPWEGEIYRTRPGLKHFPFTTFEQFLRAVLAITGWPLECTASHGNAVAASGVSRPISGR